MATLALKPPMGWNTWNTFCWKIDEELIKETADYIVENGFRDAGYTIISIDDLWMLRERDKNGDLVPDPAKFPSGMKALGDYLHERGLKFGIYANGGVRTYAGGAGSYGYERQDAKKFAEWGADLLKYDFGYPPPGCDPVIMFRRMGQALRESGRDIIFSACNSADGVWNWMRTAGAHMWRIKGDIQDSWQSIKNGADKALELGAFSGPGGWNDPDMLVVGVNGEGWVGKLGGGSTTNEYLTHFAMWCMLSAPLLMGHDVRKTTPEIRDILLNKELIAINQDDAGIPGYRIPSAHNELLAKPLANGDIAFCMINKEDIPRDVPLSWEPCGWEVTDRISFRDVTNHKDCGVFSNGGAFVTVEAHSCVVLRGTRL